jgi:hypothetical protein
VLNYISTGRILLAYSSCTLRYANEDRELSQIERRRLGKLVLPDVYSPRWTQFCYLWARPSQAQGQRLGNSIKPTRLHFVSAPARWPFRCELFLTLTRIFHSSRMCSSPTKGQSRLINILLLLVLHAKDETFCLCGLVVKSSWLHIQTSRVRFPELPYFMRSSESGTGSAQPCEYNSGASWKKK